MLTDKPRIPIREVLLYGLWPGFLKILIYRLRGYRIGKSVSIGFGSVICGDQVEIGDHTSIGFLTIIRGKQIRLGPYVQIGSTTFLDTPYLEIGEGTKINEQVFVGGLQFPDSRFVMGRNCQIMQMSFINPARSITVGDDSGIGGHCLVFGHTSWLSAFEGYNVDFEPIEIGSSVSLAWGVFVLPKTRIGDGSVIGANSVVHGTIPPKCLAVGFPARVVSKAPDFPRHMSDEDKVLLFRRVVAEMLQYFAGCDLNFEGQGPFYQIWQHSRAWWMRARRPWSLYVVESEIRQVPDLPVGKHVDVLLSLRQIPNEVRESLRAAGTTWIDIERKERSRETNELCAEVTQFLKRYGVRTLLAS